MDKPKCKTCGERHYGPCYSTSEATTDSLHPKPVVVSITAPKPPKAAANLDKPAFDRTGYQREYMRKRRAEAKVSSRPAEP